MHKVPIQESFMNHKTWKTTSYNFFKFIANQNTVETTLQYPTTTNSDRLRHSHKTHPTHLNFI